MNVEDSVAYLEFCPLPARNFSWPCFSRSISQFKEILDHVKTRHQQCSYCIARFLNRTLVSENSRPGLKIPHFLDQLWQKFFNRISGRFLLSYAGFIVACREPRGHLIVPQRYYSYAPGWNLPLHLLLKWFILVILNLYLFSICLPISK